MKVYTLLFFLFITIHCLSQEAETKKFFTDISHSEELYTDEVLQEDKIKELKNLLNKDVLVSCMGGLPEQAITLTPEEKTYIAAEADKLKNISQTTYLNNIEGYRYVDKRKSKLMAFYSRPIFIRNNTLCIIYEQHIAISGRKLLSGLGTWNIYKIRGEKWQSFLGLTFWAS